MQTENLATCRFYVEIGGIAQAVFTEVSGLQLEVETFDFQEGGQNFMVHRLPGRTKASNITLRRGWTGSDDFYYWLLQIASGKIQEKNLSVVMYNAAGKEMTRWDIIGAYPVKWVAPALKANEASAAVESLELAYSMFRLMHTHI